MNDQPRRLKINNNSLFETKGILFFWTEWVGLQIGGGTPDRPKEGLHCTSAPACRSRMVQRRTEPGTPAWHASRFFPRPVDLTRSRVPVLNAVGTVVERARAWAGDTIHELRVDSPLPCRREQPGGSRAPLPLPWTARVAPHTCVRTVDSYSYLFLLRLRMS